MKKNKLDNKIINNKNIKNVIFDINKKYSYSKINLNKKKRK